METHPKWILPYFRRRLSWAGVGNCTYFTPYLRKLGEALASALSAFCRRTSTGMDGPYFTCNMQTCQAAGHPAAPVSREQRRLGNNNGHQWKLVSSSLINPWTYCFPSLPMGSLALHIIALKYHPIMSAHSSSHHSSAHRNYLPQLGAIPVLIASSASFQIVTASSSTASCSCDALIISFSHRIHTRWGYWCMGESRTWEGIVSSCILGLMKAGGRHRGNKRSSTAVKQLGRLL